MEDLERVRAIDGADNGAKNYEMVGDYENIMLDGITDPLAIDAKSEGKRARKRQNASSPRVARDRRGAFP